MKNVLWFLMTFLVFNALAETSAINSPFSLVYKVISSNDHKLYLVTDNGTWLLQGDVATRIDSLKRQQVALKQDSIVKLPTQKDNHIASWNGVFILMTGVILGLIVFVLYRSANLKNKQYMVTLRQQKRLMDLCFWVTGDTVLDCDITQNYVEKVTDNKGFYAFDDIPFLSEKYLQQIHVDDRTLFRTQYEAVLSGGNNSYQMMYRFADGETNWKWIVERGCVIERSESGRATRVVTNLRDETELRREQNNLVRINHALERKLANVLQ